MASVDPLEGEGGHLAFAKSERADFPLLSDPDKSVATKYGVLSARGFANRWTFYIDKRGKVAHIEKTVNPATSAEGMLAKLGELKVRRPAAKRKQPARGQTVWHRGGDRAEVTDPATEKARFPKGGPGPFPSELRLGSFRAHHYPLPLQQASEQACAVSRHARTTGVQQVIQPGSEVPLVWRHPA